MSETFHAVVVLNDPSSCIVAAGASPKVVHRAVAPMLNPLLRDRKEKLYRKVPCECAIEFALSKAAEMTIKNLGNDWLQTTTDKFWSMSKGLDKFERSCLLHRLFADADAIHHIVFSEINIHWKNGGLSSFCDQHCSLCNGVGHVLTRENIYGRIKSWKICNTGYFEARSLAEVELPQGFCSLCYGEKTVPLKSDDRSSNKMLVAAAEVDRLSGGDSYRCFVDADCRAMSASDAEEVVAAGGEVYISCPKCDGGVVTSPSGHISTVGRFLAMLESDPGLMPTAISVETPDLSNDMNWYERKVAKPFSDDKTQMPDFWVGGMVNMLRAVDPGLICVSVECQD